MHYESGPWKIAKVLCDCSWWKNLSKQAVGLFTSFCCFISVVNLAPSKYLSCSLLFFVSVFVVFFLFYVAVVNTAWCAELHGPPIVTHLIAVWICSLCVEVPLAINFGLPLQLFLVLLCPLGMFLVCMLHVCQLDVPPNWISLPLLLLFCGGREGYFLCCDWRVYSFHSMSPSTCQAF